MERASIFADRLNGLLAENDIKQVDLAKHLNVTKMTISRYCDGRIPDADTLDRMARFFGVSVDYLLGRVSDPHGNTGSTYLNPNRTKEQLLASAGVSDQVTHDLIMFLRGRELTDDDVEAVKDLLEARRLRRERERGKSQP